MQGCDRGSVARGHLLLCMLALFPGREWAAFFFSNMCVVTDTCAWGPVLDTYSTVSCADGRSFVLIVGFPYLLCSLSLAVQGVCLRP